MSAELVPKHKHRRFTCDDCGKTFNTQIEYCPTCYGPVSPVAVPHRKGARA